MSKLEARERHAAAALAALGYVLNRDHHGHVRLDESSRDSLNLGIRALIKLSELVGLDPTAVAERAVKIATVPN
jgi:hypothetical protein